jgi:hypothetical protein
MKGISNSTYNLNYTMTESMQDKKLDMFKVGHVCMSIFLVHGDVTSPNISIHSQALGIRLNINI